MTNSLWKFVISEMRSTDVKGRVHVYHTSRHVIAESKNGVVYFVKESLLEDLYLMTAHVWPFNVLVGLWG